MIAVTELHAPHIDYAGLSPLLALTGGACLTLVVGLFRGPAVRLLVALTTLATLALATAFAIWQLGENKSIIEGALRIDDFALTLDFVFFAAAAVTVLLSLERPPAQPGREGDYYALLLASVTGMTVLASANNLIVLFLGIELLSIPLYVMCAGRALRRERLEAGLKYLVIGSLGSATLVYGLAFIYGATGSTDFAVIQQRLLDNDLASDALLLTGLALAITGLAFKASVAPFHQWTPDVYQGAPTPVTAFMAVATKAAAFAILVRFLDVAMFPARDDWDIALAVLGAVSIVIGNVGAIGQDSLKRMLAWSGVAQAGYILAGVVVANRTGVEGVVFYLLVYLLMNAAAFAVVIARERETTLGDSIEAIEGLGAERPVLAWPLTISMLALAGLPGTAGFIGKFFLIEGAVEGDFTWLGVAIVIGTMISLVYYLRVIAAMWMRSLPAVAPAIAGGSPDADAEPSPRAGTTAVIAVAVVMAAASIFFGIVPSPLLDLASDAGASISQTVSP